MNKFMTKEYINQIQCYQIPIAFFQNPRYIPMRNESKLAYMFMAHLLPQVDENGDSYIELPRADLMALLQIKSTQKASNVIKELVEHRLIVYKKTGLGRYNKIYLCPVEEVVCM